VDDALSRRGYEKHIVAISMYKTDLKNQIIVGANSYQNYLKIKEIL
jgi:hypothetical protein